MKTQDIAVLTWSRGPDRVAGRLAFRPWDPAEIVRKNPAGVVSALEEVLSAGDD